ncbi:uncharacterized protein LOC131675169 isoform X1 [Phymastichus coffea]|uniref:uncharacterized protein LOC131675169 isoform X1 n=1 Tax=Phymastichus coffea TaxID=108790 RepID=UPI00273C9F56|nr:uncharacterized protein LOC131675169 isoform X1 [Phymastichus coffea]
MSAAKTFLMLCIISYSMNQGNTYCNNLKKFYSIEYSAIQSIILTFFFFTSIVLAFSISCYQCDSRYNPECDSYSKKENFAFHCSIYAKSSASLLNTTLLSLQTNIAGRRGINPFNECLTLTGTWQGSKRIIRSCSSTAVPNDVFENLAKALEITIESINRCQSDLCNFSSNLNIL